MPPPPPGRETNRDNIDPRDIGPADRMRPDPPRQPDIRLLGKLKGPWVSTHFVFAEAIEPVKDAEAPSTLPGYRNPVAGQYTQSTGFFVTNAVMYLDFHGNGRLTGYREGNRGRASQHKAHAIEGTYSVYETVTGANSKIYSGRIEYRFRSGKPALVPGDGPLDLGSTLTEYHYYYVMRSPTELAWMWTPPVIEAGPILDADVDSEAERGRFRIDCGILKKVVPEGVFLSFLRALGIASF